MKWYYMTFKGLPYNIPFRIVVRQHNTKSQLTACIALNPELPYGNITPIIKFIRKSNLAICQSGYFGFGEA
jgi:hypothetical protein